MKILGIDFETTGLDSDRDRVIEIGAVLWETDRKCPLQVMNCLIKHTPNENVALSKEIRDLTHIHPSDIETCGIAPTQAFESLLKLIEPVEYIVAHNGTLFDSLFFTAELKRLNLADKFKKPWIDTRTDVPYPANTVKRGQEAIEELHGIKNPFPHRAVFDALGMLQILSHYNMEDIIALSKIPMVVVKAMVSFDEKEKAKERGYYWEPKTKSWLKAIKENTLAAEISQSDFQILVIP